MNKNSVKLFISKQIDKNPYISIRALRSLLLAQLKQPGPVSIGSIYNYASQTDNWMGGRKGRPRKADPSDKLASRAQLFFKYYTFGIPIENNYNANYWLYSIRLRTTSCLHIRNQARSCADVWVVMGEHDFQKLFCIWRPIEPVAGAGRSTETIYRDRMESMFTDLFRELRQHEETIVRRLNKPQYSWQRVVTIYSGSRTRTAVSGIVSRLLESNRSTIVNYKMLREEQDNDISAIFEWIRAQFRQAIANRDASRWQADCQCQIEVFVQRRWAALVDSSEWATP